MAGVTDHPFRLICRQYGAGVVYTEFVSANGIIRENIKTLEMMRFTEEERPLGIQIFGDDPEVVGQSAKMVNEKFPGSLVNENTETHIQLAPDHWFEIATWLKSEPSLSFDSLQCQTGVDIGENTLDARYNLHSMQHNHCTEIRISVSIDKPIIPSVEQIWRIADWFERETYDMLGIEFSDHRDLRRILLPDDWEGWPLRKDYQVQETYHGIEVPKMKEGWE